MTAAALDYQTRLAAFDLGPTPSLLLEEKKAALRAQRAAQVAEQEAKGYRATYGRATWLTPEERAAWYQVFLRKDWLQDRPYDAGARAGIVAAERRAAAIARRNQKRTALGWPAGAKARRINL